MTDKTVRIGCSAGFWGDSAMAAPQLVRRGRIDYLVADYLAEVTMSLLARARIKNPAAGFAADFVTSVAPLMPEIAAQGIKLVSNAGGINPNACRNALLEAAEAAGVSLTVAVVDGDDLMPRLEEIKMLAPCEMFSRAPFPLRPVSMNAYLGARPIAAALDAGAQVVITGRCVDSAMVLGALMHEFGWRDQDYDLLAAGSLAGHVIECGAQCTGGLFTDWNQVQGWEDIGYPIVECQADGTFTVTKPEGTGGLVSTGTVAEQILYEIGDPGAYLLPDVVCDFTNVRVEPSGPDRVTVQGARGGPPTPHYKVCATYADGFRALATLMIGGFEADGKARKTAAAILTRTRRLFSERGYGDYAETSVEVLGAEDTYGAHARLESAREVILKIGVRHPRKDALELFAREVAPAATSMAQGITGFFGGRPRVTPVVRLFSFLMDKPRVPVTVNLPESAFEVPIMAGEPFTPAKPDIPARPGFALHDPTAWVPLLALAYARSGDKGDNANIGVIARDPAFVPVLREQLTTEVVNGYFAHLLNGEVERFELPGLNAFNFLLHKALGGGGIASLRYDPQGKAFGAMLLDLPVEIPAQWLQPGGSLANYPDGPGALEGEIQAAIQ